MYTGLCECLGLFVFHLASLFNFLIDACFTLLSLDIIYLIETGGFVEQKLNDAFVSEMTAAIKYYHAGDLNQAFHHLERAHILGQSYTGAHTYAHWWMLRVGVKRHDVKEVLGQISRIFASIVFSKIWVPLGNTGGSNVNPIKPMPIPNDLQQYLSK